MTSILTVRLLSWILRIDRETSPLKDDASMNSMAHPSNNISFSRVQESRDDEDGGAIIEDPLMLSWEEEIEAANCASFESRKEKTCLLCLESPMSSLTLWFEAKGEYWPTMPENRFLPKSRVVKFGRKDAWRASTDRMTTGLLSCMTFLADGILSRMMLYSWEEGDNSTPKSVFLRDRNCSLLSPFNESLDVALIGLFSRVKVSRRLKWWNRRDDKFRRLLFVKSRCSRDWRPLKDSLDKLDIRFAFRFKNCQE